MPEMELTAPQWEFFNLSCRFPAFVGGYGSGKTACKLACAIRDMFQNPGANVALYDPTYDLARLNTVPRLCELLESMPVKWEQNRQANIISVQGYGQFIIRTLENPARIVAYEVWRSHVDELDTLRQDQAEEAWNRIIARNRQALQSGAPNRVSVYTTPEGFRFVYDRWVRRGGDDYAIVHAPTLSNPHLPEEYVDSLRASYPAQLLDAYLEGLFVNLTAGNVFSAFDRDRCHSKEVVKPREPLHIGMDFNVTKQCVVVHVIRHGIPHAVDEFINLYDTPSAIDAIKSRYPEHHITVYPDATGAARKSVNASLSDIALLRQAGFTVRANKTNPTIKDRVQAVNVLLEKGHYFINLDTCREYAEALEQLAYDKNGVPDKTSGFDHVADAGTYYIAYAFPIIRYAPTGVQHWR